MAIFEWHGIDTTAAPTTTTAFNFKRANYTDMNAHLASIDFTALFDGKTITEKVNLLHNVLNDAIVKFVPTYIVKSIQKNPWKIVS